MRNRIISILLICCIVIPLILASFSGCGSDIPNTEDLQKQFLANLTDSASSTGSMLTALKGKPVEQAAQQFVRCIQITDLDCSIGKNKRYTVSCTLEIPNVESIQKALSSSDSFKKEYNSVKDKVTCIYNYTVNALLNGTDITKNETKIENDDITIASAINTTQKQIDATCRNALSAFALATLYNPDDTKGTQNQQFTFIESADLSDFVFKIGKNKVLVSDIEVVEGSDALDKLTQLSSNNALVCPDSNDKLIVIKYKLTNLSTKTITLDNYFRLGDASSHLYTNTGYHVEGLSTATKVKYGQSKEFCTALVGDTDSQLYFYSKVVKGARHWKEIPLS